MFDIYEIFKFVKFLNDYGIEFSINNQTNEVEFFYEDRTMSIPIETFEYRSMRKNIERIRVWIDKEDYNASLRSN